MCEWRRELVSGGAPSDKSPSSFQVFSSDREVQARAVQVTCAFGQLTALTTHWPGEAPPGTRAARLGEELRQEVKQLGGYLQVFLQVGLLAGSRISVGLVLSASPRMRAVGG